VLCHRARASWQRQFCTSLLSNDLGSGLIFLFVPHLSQIGAVNVSFFY